MATEKYYNNAASTLNGAITNSATTLVVTSATPFPTVPQFRILINNEKMLVTGVSSTTFTVTRGIEGTTAASHADLAPIISVLTKGALDQILADNCQRGVVASLPSAERAGRMYVPSDAMYLFRDNGAAWDAAGPIWPMTPPVLSDFTWTNQGSATVTQVGGSLLISNGASGVNYKILRVNTPSTPYTLTAYLLNGYFGDTGEGGLVFLETSSGKLMTLQRSGLYIEAKRYNSVTSLQDSPYSLSINQLNDQYWYRLVNDGTNLSFMRSANGYTFYSDYTVAKNSWFTTGPDQIGFGINNGTAHGLTLLSWKFT